MGAVVDAVGDIVGGVVDAVGSVAEGAVSLAGDAIEAVASNPLLLAAAVATPFALGAMAGTAAGAGALSAADVGLSGLGTGMLEAGIPSALEVGAGFGYGTAAGLGAGTVAGAAEALGTGFSLSGLGSIYADGAVTSAFNFAPLEQATTFGSSILDATGANLATFDASQTAASTVMGQSPTFAFDSNYLSSDVFTQAQEASSLASSPGMSFSNAIQTATNGAVAPNASTGMFSSAWDSAKGIAQSVSDINSQAGKLMNTIGQTIAPNADPFVQKMITNTAVNTVTSGGDIKQGLESSLIGGAAGLAGSTVAGATADTLGKTGSTMLGGAASNATGTLLSGGDLGSSLIGSGVGALGSGVTSLTGSPLLGGAAKTVAGTAIGGGDVGNALTNFGINAGIGAGTGYLTNLLGTGAISNNSPLGMIKNAVTPALTGMVTGSAPPKASSLLSSSLTKSLAPSPLSTSKAPTLLQSGSTNVTNPSTSGNAPPQKVDVATLKPVTDIASILGKKI